MWFSALILNEVPFTHQYVLTGRYCAKNTQDEITRFRISETWRKHATPCFRYVYVKVVRFRCIRSNGNARKRHETGNGNTGYPSCFRNGLTCFCHVSVYGFLQFRPVIAIVFPYVIFFLFDGPSLLGLTYISLHLRQVSSIPLFKHILKLCTLLLHAEGVGFVLRMHNASPSTNPSFMGGKARPLEGVKCNTIDFTRSCPYMVD